jgi:hypothetical protein
MALKPESALMISAVTVASVLSIFQLEAPPLANVRAAAPGGQTSSNTFKSVKGATITSAAVVGLIALLAKSPEVYTVGGLTVAILAFKYHKANVTHPVTQAIVAPGDGQSPVSGGGSIQGGPGV